MKTKLYVKWKDWVSPYSWDDDFSKVEEFREKLQFKIDLNDINYYRVKAVYSEGCYRIELDANNRIDLYEDGICLYHEYGVEYQDSEYHTMIQILKPLAASDMVSRK